MNYRIADKNDIPLLAEMNAVMIEDEGHSNPMSVRQLKKRMRTWLDGIYKAVIIEAGGEDVGYVLFRDSDDGVMDGGIYVRHYFIARHRRREGLGREAFKMLQDTVWENCPRITLETLIQNTRARAFWGSLGFHEYCITFERINK